MTLRRLVPYLPATLLVFATAVTASGAFERQHAPHVHGHGVGSMAQDGGLFTLSLILPGVNLAGFEHPPRDERQQATLGEIVSHLEGGEWLRFDSNGTCDPADITVGTPGFDSRAPAERRHDDNHHHDHDRDRPHEHAEFQVDVTFECDQPEGLSWLEIDLFTAYPGNEQIRLDVLADHRTGRARLRPGDFRIGLGATR